MLKLPPFPVRLPLRFVVPGVKLPDVRVSVPLISCVPEDTETPFELSISTLLNVVAPDIL